MKKHLVMVTGGYYPDPSPTGKCAKAYIDLLKDDYDIEVVSITRGEKNPYTYDGELINPIGSKYYYFRKWAEKKYKNNLVNNVLKIPGWIIRPFVHPNIFGWYVNIAWKKLEEIHKHHPIDAVFSACAPVACHGAAMKFKQNHPEIAWVAYTVDSYTAQQNSDAKQKSAMRYERKVLAQADKVLLSEEIYSSMPWMFEKFNEKCAPLPYLMPQRRNVKSDKRFLQENKINLVYVGRFYKKIRNPEYLLKTAMGLDEKYVLNLFTSGDCIEMVRNYEEKSGGRIICHPWATPEEIECVYSEADILVNVGNGIPEFKPSKTFEYITTGKPIVNFYYPGLDDVEMRNSPVVLQIEMSGDAEKQTANMQKFMENVYGKRLDEAEVDRLYPKHSEENIRNILYNSLG